MKNKVLNTFINGFKYAFVSQIIVLLLGVIKSILLPKILSVDGYGYWQIYLLYSTYVGIFMLGYNDGVYLKYGKYDYDDLPVKKLRSSNRIYLLILFILTIICSILTNNFVDKERAFIMLNVSIDIFFMGIYGLFIYISQITNQFKKYGFFSVFDKIILVLLIFISMLFKDRNYKYIVFFDVFSKIIVSLFMLYEYRTLLFGNCDSLSIGFEEYRDSVKSGINLMFALLSGQIITNLGKIILDFFGNIKEYAYYSLGVSITNLILIFINSISTVLYPTLTRVNKESYKKYYIMLNELVFVIGLFSLLIYYPACIFLRHYLPNYLSVLKYLHILFVVVVVQAKTQIVVYNFLKILREEAYLLKINIVCIVVFMVASLILFIPTKNIKLIAISTLISFMTRCYVSEFILNKYFDTNRIKHSIFESIIFLLYIFLIEFLDFRLSILVYLLVIIVYIYIKRDTIKILIKQIDVD